MNLIRVALSHCCCRTSLQCHRVVMLNIVMLLQHTMTCHVCQTELNLWLILDSMLARELWNGPTSWPSAITVNKCRVRIALIVWVYCVVMSSMFFLWSFCLLQLLTFLHCFISQYLNFFYKFLTCVNLLTNLAWYSLILLKIPLKWQTWTTYGCMATGQSSLARAWTAT